MAHPLPPGPTGRREKKKKEQEGKERDVSVERSHDTMGLMTEMNATSACAGTRTSEVIWIGGERRATKRMAEGAPDRVGDGARSSRRTVQKGYRPICIGMIVRRVGLRSTII